MRLKKILISISTFITIFIFSTSYAKFQITNGTTVPQGKYPFFVALGLKHEKIDAKFGGGCGGSLIAPNWVVTARHCVLAYSADEQKVAVGSADLSDPSSYQIANVTKVFYVDSDLKGPIIPGKDIALLQLDRNITLAPIELSSHRPSSRMATVIGQGMNEAHVIPPVVKETDIPVTYDESCDSPEIHKYHLDLVPMKELCVGSHTGISKKIMSGDSGGPLIQKINGQFVLIGIVSRKITVNDEINSPSIVTSISYYYPWIMDTINKN